MSEHYTDEKNTLIIVALLKANGVRKIIASPGGTNVAFVASVQYDSFFEVYSAVDERSAAYMACGLAHETGEPVVICCTGATSSRNYMPGMTEAYYRKLPVLAITYSQFVGLVGHNVAQVTDRSNKPNDTQRISLELPVVKDDDDWWECEVKVNQAILELKRGGGGPVHVNVPTHFNKKYQTKTLPACRVIERFTTSDKMPALNGKVIVFVGAHSQFTLEQTAALDGFCATNDAVVFCDHTSGYRGKYRIGYALGASQQSRMLRAEKPDVTIHIGEVSGDYPSVRMVGGEVWRVSKDGELRDTFKRLRYVFEMDEVSFFNSYTDPSKGPFDKSLKRHQRNVEGIRKEVPDIPFSNVWIAARIAKLIPENSVIHFGILNSLRCWNLFELPPSVTSTANVGGFGIDGSLSSLVGASLANKDKLYFGVIGDLAFFYDMNALGNRHVGNNLRIILVNNGKGAEFRRTGSVAVHFGEKVDEFISASGHFGNKSPSLVKNYALGLGLQYISASSKKQFEFACNELLAKSNSKKSILVEVFTNSHDESTALDLITQINKENKAEIKKIGRRILGDKSVDVIKRLVGR